MSGEKFFYTNGAEIAFSQYDVTLKLMRNGTGSAHIGESVSAEAGEKPAIVHDVIDVAMSVSHAKAMLAGLIRVISDYESQFGEIPLASDAKEKWRQACAGIKSSP